MKIIILFLSLFALYCAIQPQGVIDRVYSKEGLQDFYNKMFKNVQNTWNEDLGKTETHTGWWIFGTGLSIKKTKFSKIDMGKGTGVEFDQTKKQFTFDRDQMSATFDYTWYNRWFLFSFGHPSTCDVKLNNFKIVALYEIKHN